MRIASALLTTAVAPAGAAAAVWTNSYNKTISYSPVQDVFLQDDSATVPSTFDYASVNFGLINRTYPSDASISDISIVTQWQKFAQFVEYLNSAGCRKTSRENVRYKVLFMGRHGEGWHNAAETFYGTPAWNCYWAEQDGNGTANWADPLLTPAGLAQATKANAYFKDRYATQKMPYFDAYYASPLTRCTTTANLTFADITSIPTNKPFVPLIKEGLREGMTPQTCNSRSNRTTIHALFPTFQFEPGFTEEDELWHDYDSETDAAELARARQALDDIFREGDDSAVWISITSHSGLITRLLSALGHRAFSLSTGQIIPVLVKAQLLDEAPSPAVEAYEPYSTCNAPPISSNAAQGCICSSTISSGLAAATA